MSIRVDPTLLPELVKYGAFDVNACFNCGNCTAICPLSTETENFPRKMIRYAQVGLRDRLLTTNELWLCYYCGECSDTCPREAEPGEFMQAARRYAIASYDLTRLSRLLYTSAPFSVIFLLLLGALLTVIMLAGHGPMSPDSLALFADGAEGFVSAELVHNVGITVIGIVVLAGIVSIANMVYRMSRSARGLAGSAHEGEQPANVVEWVSSLVRTIFTEVFAERRYRDCDEEKQQSWVLKPWFVHGSILWGFLGLLTATALDWILDLTGIKATGTMVPLWYPVRLLGTVSGIFLVYGTTVAIVKRLGKSDKPSSHSLLSDWVFVLLLWLAGVTGFALEIALYLPAPQIWGYYMLIAHVVISMELILLVPFTKFAHAFYRTTALVIHNAHAGAGPEVAAMPPGSSAADA